MLHDHIRETESVGTCLDMAIQPYTALYSSIQGNDFPDAVILSGPAGPYYIKLFTPYGYIYAHI